MIQREDSGQETRAASLPRAAGIAGLAGLAAAALTGVAASLGLTAAAASVPVGIVVAFIVAALHYWKTQQALISAGSDRTARQAYRRIEDSLAQTRGLVQLSSAGLPFPLEFGAADALAADAAAVLAREVTMRRPRVVVELGSGVSTILVGCLLHQLGAGRIYSLQHEVARAAATREQVSAAGLEECVEVFDAPLVDHQVGNRQYSWYTMPDAVKRLDSIDLLIVDGPPQRVDPSGLPRYPALPLFVAKLSKNAAVFVDDAKRPAETEMVRLWLEHCPGWVARWIPTVPGTFVLSQKQLPAEF